MFARALGGGAITAFGYAMSQFLRLVSNLVLTRLLFPEAFGLMSLVTMVLVGLQMVLDAGVNPAIMRSQRGDDADFLNTAWSLNVMRGVMLWGLAAAFAWPIAQFYGEPDLIWLICLTGLSLPIAGLNPTRIDSAQRHLLLGKVTMLDLLAQAISLIIIAILAALTGAIWSLALGAVIGAGVKLGLMHFGLPGARNRFRWDRSAVHELLHFGKWIILSTACGFLLHQGDKAILGVYLDMNALGVYNIGYFLASFPILMGGAVTSRVMIALYRDRHPAQSAQNAIRFRQLKLGVSGGLLVMLAIMGLIGPELVHILYDQRYAQAQLIVPAVVLALLPGVLGMGYDQAALAAGDGRGFFILLAIKAVLQTLGLVIGAHYGGLAGALLGQGLALLASHPFIAILAYRHHAWDAGHDVVIGGGILAVAAVIFAWHGAGLWAV